MKQTIELHKKWKSDPSKGEVFTPSELVREILDKIPTSVWENPESIFLDPCMGKGTFLIEIITRLINIYGYSKEDAVSRVYGYDTCVKYINYLKRGGLVNVSHKNFLNEEINMKFDVIIGNPPYQETHKDGGFQPKSHSLWLKIVQKSFDLVKKDGYTCFVTPNSWGSPTNTLFKSFKEKQLEYVNVDLNNFFKNVGSTFTYWILKNQNNQSMTKIGDIIVDFSNMEYLPSDTNINSISVHKKVIFDNKKEVFNFVCDTTSNHSTKGKKNGLWSKDMGGEYVYPVFHTNSQSFYSKFQTTNHNSIKIMFTISGYYKPFLDLGETSGSEIVMSINVDNIEEGQNLMSILNSKLYRFIINTAKWSGFLNKEVVRNLPKMDTSISWSDNSIYKYFGLTPDEINYVESYEL
jgi:hypothetical protein